MFIVVLLIDYGTLKDSDGGADAHGESADGNCGLAETVVAN